MNAVSNEKRCPASNFPRFQGAQTDHVRVQSSICCFPRELVSFIRLKELVSLNPRHMTRSPPIRKRIKVGRCNNTLYLIPLKAGRIIWDHSDPPDVFLNEETKMVENLSVLMNEWKGPL